MDYKLKPRKEAISTLHSNIGEAVFSSIEKAKSYPFATCLSCLSFIESKGYCSTHKSNPPPRVIVYSCPDYFDNDDIPF